MRTDGRDRRMDGCISTAWTDKKFYGMDTGILEFFLLTGNELGIRWWVSGYTRRKTNTDTHGGLLRISIPAHRIPLWGASDTRKEHGILANRALGFSIYLSLFSFSFSLSLARLL